ncbi:hypothetical protein Q4Q49_16340 [Shewanella sp. SP1S1-7]|uniref:hypothetical protein n=1 Tax=unclassified Shewanella TaxID=196818 RepID=UPI00289171EF|nr:MULTISPECIES: hypothetical protein [unclassified Shewanella]MDT3322104.1 hypothetical protein [Shewanella sp. SP1S2-4]MDT3336858.1 hypothetical protein [Shewanella sp. SP1S1-7]
MSQIQDRQALGEFLNLACESGWPDVNLVMMLTPPHELLSEEMIPCSDNNNNNKSSQPYSYLSPQDEAWLFEAHRIIQKDYFNYMSQWLRPEQPQEMSFLHRAFATRPYLTARMMASARGPHIGDAWRLLATHMDRILLVSNHDEDRRLLAYAMARDSREHAALDIIAEQLQKGDALALQVLPYVALDMPEPIDDEMADMSEPELGYRVVPMLESYIIQQNYPTSFCHWAAQLKQGPLKYYANMVVNNFDENLACSKEPD